MYVPYEAPYPTVFGTYSILNRSQTCIPSRVWILLAILQDAAYLFGFDQLELHAPAGPHYARRVVRVVQQRDQELP